MNIRTLIAAAAITAFTGSAIAQTADVGTDQGDPQTAEWGSNQEQMLFQEHGTTLWPAAGFSDTRLS
ncbi:hypothetical protein GRZ55_22840 [Chelativorans sp. ZYF759]|uniref:hypothetical protein n=1 Tax=Chelativorans sp. ZYF759 TaxID=2692213 RepID=UPI00145CB9C8|nr:hypothetical protein [Chelativorans sp. ZYF759]NMG42060.1 hypothetical protein [Chelativorans sp. ZYF759]